MHSLILTQFLAVFETFDSPKMIFLPPMTYSPANDDLLFPTNDAVVNDVAGVDSSGGSITGAARFFDHESVLW